MKNKMSYQVSKNSCGEQQIVMVGKVRDNEHSGYTWNEIVGEDGMDLGTLLEEFEGKQVKVVVTVCKDK